MLTDSAPCFSSAGHDVIKAMVVGYLVTFRSATFCEIVTDNDSSWSPLWIVNLNLRGPGI